MPIETRAAVAFAPNEKMQFRNVLLADPQAGQVGIRLLASGLCHSDLHVLDGSSPAAFPIILGHEGIGEVVSLGAGVREFEIGDRVMPYLVPDCGVCAFCRSGRTNLCVQFVERLQAGQTPFSLDGKPVAAFMGLGTFSEYTVVEQDMLIKVSTDARPDHACCIGCAITTGLGAVLLTAKVPEGSSVAVFGMGGVGMSVVQGARIAKASTIIAIDTNSRKKNLSLSLGATHFINPKEVADVPAAVHELTKLGADFSFECVGRPELVEVALQSTNPAWGEAVIVGVLPAGARIQTEPGNLMFGRRWRGSMMGSAKRADMARFVDMYVAGDFDLDEVVSHRLTFEEINDGFDMLKSGEANKSVVILGR